MDVAAFEYDLPEELIAQAPTEKRDESRLMVVNRKTGEIQHKHFFDITNYLEEGDCLVFNNSRVIPARIFGVKRETGVQVEFLLIKNIEADIWETMVRPGRRLKVGDIVDFPHDVSAKILKFGEDGTRIVEFSYDGIFMERLEQIGNMPLPPYIDRKAIEMDKERYQTVYSKIDGSVAAPTAGLHFTEELINKIKEKGVTTAYVTLHVGIGTFRPVKVDRVEDHKMHFEEYSISKEAADSINKAKAAGKRVISVGTTSTRTLESCASKYGKIIETRESTGIFIYPGYEFKIIDSLITNFHLPKSTLLMLISAFYNREKILEAYKIAVEEKYRFFSYGDAMMLR